MSSKPEPCPTCPGNMQIPPGYIEELIAAKRSAGLNLVDDRVYQLRLETCVLCDACVEGAMCRKCGCFVQLRALSSIRSCPHPEGDRWAEILEDRRWNSHETLKGL